MKIHHIGYLVKDMDKSIKAFEAMDYKLCSETQYDPYRRIYLCFLENSGYIVELVSPKDDESVAWKLLKKYGNSPYHICYEAENLEERIEILTKQGYVIVANPEVAVGINGVRVAFLMGRDVGLIELAECKDFRWEKTYE